MPDSLVPAGDRGGARKAEGQGLLRHAARPTQVPGTLQEGTRVGKVVPLQVQGHWEMPMRYLSGGVKQTDRQGQGWKEKLRMDSLSIHGT